MGGVEEFHLGRKPPGRQRRLHHPRVGAFASQQSARLVSRQSGSSQHTYLCQGSHQTERWKTGTGRPKRSGVSTAAEDTEAFARFRGPQGAGGGGGEVTEAAA